MELMGAQDPTKLSVLNKEEGKVGMGVSRLLPRSATKDKRLPIHIHLLQALCQKHHVLATTAT